MNWRVQPTTGGRVAVVDEDNYPIKTFEFAERVLADQYRDQLNNRPREVKQLAAAFQGQGVQFRQRIRELAQRARDGRQRLA